MELRQLQQFLMVVRHRNFSRAADALGVSQQALSHSIANLEKDLGTRLFDRGQFGAEITPIGETLAKRLRLITAELELARAEVDALQNGAKGQVTVGVNTVIGERILPATIVRFAAERPDVSVRVHVSHSEGLFESLLAGEIDFAVTTPLEPLDRYAELQHEPVGRGFAAEANYLVMRTGHPLARRRKIGLEDLRTYPWIDPAAFSSFSQRLIELFHEAGVAPPAYILRTDSINVCKAILLQSDFVCILGRAQTALEEEQGLLRGVVIPGLEATAPAYFCYRKRFAIQPAATALLQTFKKVLQQRGRL
jgi:DNA-binding transcriptional LysR family regulator